MIKITNLSKAYGNIKVLENINLELNKGKIYGIVGENGAGKTTLFNCIAGIETYKGKIESGYISLKDHLGFLQTESYFFSKITGREYIQLLSIARNKKIETIEEKNIFDLPLNKYAVTYSIGMKKKLALTGLLLQENDVFIFDEPFNGVDIQSNIIITEIILKLKELKKTIIISSHIFSTLSDICDEIHLLKEGTFIKRVYREDFDKLAKEMKAVTITNRIDRLNLV